MTTAQLLYLIFLPKDARAALPKGSSLKLTEVPYDPSGGVVADRVKGNRRLRETTESFAKKLASAKQRRVLLEGRGEAKQLFADAHAALEAIVGPIRGEKGVWVDDPLGDRIRSAEEALALPVEPGFEGHVAIDALPEALPDRSTRAASTHGLAKIEHPELAIPCQDEHHFAAARDALAEIARDVFLGRSWAAGDRRPLATGGTLVCGAGPPPWLEKDRHDLSLLFRAPSSFVGGNARPMPVLFLTVEDSGGHDVTLRWLEARRSSQEPVQPGIEAVARALDSLVGADEFTPGPSTGAPGASARAKDLSASDLQLLGPMARAHEPAAFFGRERAKEVRRRLEQALGADVPAGHLDRLESLLTNQSSLVASLAKLAKASAVDAPALAADALQLIARLAWSLDPMQAGFAAEEAARIDAGLGNGGRARALLEWLVARAAPLGHTLPHSQGLVGLRALDEAAGDPEAKLRFERRSIAYFQERGDADGVRGHLFPLFRELVEAAGREKDPARVVALADEGLALGDGDGGELRASRGRALLALGRRDEAKGDLQTAHGQLARHGPAAAREEVARQLAELGVEVAVRAPAPKLVATKLAKVPTPNEVVRALLAAHNAAQKSGNVEPLTALFLPDAELVLAGVVSGTFRGPDAIARAWLEAPLGGPLAANPGESKKTDRAKATLVLEVRAWVERAKLELDLTAGKVRRAKLEVLAPG